MHFDGAIRNIEKEINRECYNRGIQNNENFLTYYLKLLALDPTWGINNKETPQRRDVKTFIAHVISEVRDPNTPSMIALRMQYYFTCNFQQKQKMIKRNRSELLARLKNLEQEIIDAKNLVEEEEVELIYKEMVFYITLASGMGNPTIDRVFKEVRAALGSILDRTELNEFTMQPKYVKVENLMEFTRLVTGIRLFNKDCGKGGEGMEDLPRLINEGVDATNVELQKTLVTIMDKVNLMTTALDYVYVTEQNEHKHYILVCKLPKDVTKEDVEFVKNSLIVYRQHELFVRKLIDEIALIESNSNQIFTILQRALIALHRVVKHRIAIPVNQVFPHFLKLSDIWCSLQDQTILLAKINQIMSTLQKYVKCLNFNDGIAEQMLPPGETPMTDAQRLEKSKNLKIPTTDNKAMVIDSENFATLAHTKLEYLGFCAWKLITSEGALIPGNPNLGVLNSMNMNFVFSSVEGGVAFGEAPQKHVMEMINLARRKPELINLLNIKNRLILVQDIVELVRESPPLPLTEEEEVQTEVHPVETNIDRNYFWNVWDMRRQAIALAQLTKSKTTSFQTLKSYHRINLVTQTCQMRDKEVQRRRDNYSNVPKPSTFIFGLRGRKDDKQFIVDLTRPVDE